MEDDGGRGAVGSGYRSEILASYTGSTVKHTSPKKILAYQFDLPPLDEQAVIAGILGVLDDKIELNGRMLASRAAAGTMTARP